uniref:PROP1-like PPR domain-containing protein n=1 Tax=Kalanchoe fedtschenkoi TaxID=63787 RepID=A0A7N0TZJ1_KALFE
MAGCAWSGAGPMAASAAPINYEAGFCKVRGRHSPTPLFASATISSSADGSTAKDSDRAKGEGFTYSRASPSVRWPHLKLTETQKSTHLVLQEEEEEEEEEAGLSHSFPDDGNRGRIEADEVLGAKPGRTRAKKMTKLALKRAKDWRQRVQFLTHKILELRDGEFVANVLDRKLVQMTPTDYCYLVKWVGLESWQRALEVYEWLNITHWYTPNARMLATILAVLGKANQEALAVDIYIRVESGIGDTVQVYNAMMGVYARNGQFSKVKDLLDVMHARGCEPDLVSFNTMINARLRSGPMEPNLAVELLTQVRKSGLRPDIVTYNTLISACSRESNLEEALKVHDDMVAHKCLPDLWTYNAMISVYGRCGLAGKAEKLFKELEEKGFLPDAVTYNSLLYAFAKVGKVEKVKQIHEDMMKVGFGKDEMTTNTLIHMYGKQGQPDIALQLYKEIKMSGRSPDVVTYTVLIDSLGKANKITEAANVMSEMLISGVKPTLRTFSAMICGYAKAGKRLEAEETYNLMLGSGIRPDNLAYSVMLDVFLRSNEIKKVMSMYRKMIRDGFTPDRALYEEIIQFLARENDFEGVESIIKDMEELCNLDAQVISSILIIGKCYELAAKYLRLSVTQGYKLNHDDFLSVLGSFGSAGRHVEARNLVDFMIEQTPGSQQMVSEALVVMLSQAHEVDAALEEYNKIRDERFSGSLVMYESLIHACEQKELFSEASQLYSDMRFLCIEPSETIFRSLVSTYCKLGFPETAQHVKNQAELQGMFLDDISMYIALIDAYGKSQLWQKAESLVGNLRLQWSTVDRKIWNALIYAYAASGCYERARAVFNNMMRDGPTPTVESINGLLQALVVDGRLEELYVVIEDLQNMGFKLSKSSILLVLDAFARAGNIFEVKKLYSGMKAAGYFPSMHLYRIMISLFAKGNRVRDVEAMVVEMNEAGLKPDISVWNSVLKMYTAIGDFKKTAQVYQQIQDSGLKPDEDVYNTLMLMYCRDLRPEEGMSLLHLMRKLGQTPKLDTYKSLIAAFVKQQNFEQAEEIFEGLQLEGYKLDRSFYHIMMKMYRNNGDYSKAENLLLVMKSAGVEPTVATMHLLMASFGSSGHPEEAEKVLNNLKEANASLSTLPYIAVIDSYLKNGDYDDGIQKLIQMRIDGIEPDHKIWTCFIRAASRCQHSSEALVLLNALRDVGCSLPIRLLAEKPKPLVLEVDTWITEIDSMEDGAAFNFINALVDLLWAFELRATASWVFQLAIKKRIYNHNVYRVAEKDWGADFRKLSAGSALVGLTLWLDSMQDASLQGSPESPKSVVLITGTADYNMVSLNSTLKAYLWEMGSPFLPCKTRNGLLVAKAHSLRMWLKDSPFCFDLESKDAPSLPELNSMQLMEGCFIRRGLIPAFKDINERLGLIWPKKFAKLALLSDEKRDKAIEADIQGRKQKLEKLAARASNDEVTRLRKHSKRPYFRKPQLVSGPDEYGLVRQAST